MAAADADAIMAICRLIRRLGSAEPRLVTGEIAGHPRYWISTGKPPWVPPPEPVLYPDYFVTATKVKGVSLQTPQGLLAPSYWDVETTFWLRWSFTAMTLVDTVQSA
jgi:hypothetical protein